VVAGIAMDKGRLDWRPEVVHCNDWQTGLIPALLDGKPERPATVFSIHNLAYQGRFSATTFQKLKLPDHLWHYSGLEYFGDLLMIKGGLAYADRLTTVSPTYANEICTPLGGHGLDGLLTYRRGRLSGILNGVDYTIWDPAVDPLLPTNYSASKPAGKSDNKAALQKRLQLPQKADTPLLGLVSRFAEQKGIDLVLEAAPKLLRQKVQLVLLGSGDVALEKAARALAKKFPRQVAAMIGYDEGLAHLIEAGADFFLMPSRFEPCGLNQLYSLRYGTLPIVRRTGGLADTVVHTDKKSLADGTATGFVFEHPTADGLKWAVNQALDCYAKTTCQKKAMQNAMVQDFSWDRSARQYLVIYRQAIQDAHPV
jgi:starch synthase